MTKAHGAHKGATGSFPVAPKEFFRFVQPASAKPVYGDEVGIPVRELANARLFQQLSRDAVSAILGLASSRRVAANSIIFQQEASADRLYMVRTGQVRYFYLTQDGKKLILTWVRAGEIFGINAVMPARSTYLVSAETRHDSELLIWEKDVIRGLAIRYPVLWENVMQTTSDYLAFYIATHVGLVSHTARERVADLLITLAMRLGHAGPDGIELEITNQELANTANVTHFTVSRFLRDWQEQRILAKRRGGLVIHSPSQLLLASQVA
jgi:CRP/FNR family transcriptional regulator, nitrogen oxide reductase regulator